MKKIFFLIATLIFGGVLASKRPALSNHQARAFNFSVGDDVSLITRNQIMTVERILPDGKILCNYLSRKDYTYKVESFEAEDLEKVSIQTPYAKDFEYNAVENGLRAERRG